MPEHKIRFGTLSVKGGVAVEENVRMIPQSAIGRCPFLIMVADHYRADSSCRCDDPAHVEMKTWGYRWSKKAKRWG